MKKRTIVLFLLSALLSGCAPATPMILPTATIPSVSSEILTQTRVPALESTPTTLPASDINLERIAQLGGRINGITIMGDLAYVGMGPRVAAIDISQHEHPQLVRQSEALPGLVTQLLQISGGPAPLLLVNAGRYLVVMDTSNPDRLKPIHQLGLEAEISAMVWDKPNSMAYAGGPIDPGLNSSSATGFISAVGITPDSDLKLINSVALPQGRLLGMALGEGSLFAGVEGSGTGLLRIQLKNPGELSIPQQVIASTPLDPLHPLSIQVIGKRLYLSYRAVEAYDITNPDQPVQIWATNLYGGPVIDDFNLAGAQGYVFGWTILNEYVHDVMTLPQPVVGSPMGETASVTAMHNGDFLVAHNDLEIYDTANPHNLQLVGSYLPTVANAIGTVTNEKTAFVLDSGIGDGHSNAVLWALSLPDLKPLGQVMTETPNGWPGVREGSQWITLDGDRLYLASSDSVWVYDVSRMQPILLGKAEIVDGQVDAITAIKLAEKRLLVISQEISRSSVLTAYDLTDLQKPAELGSPLTLEQGNTQQMAWNGSALYVLLDTSYHSKSDILYAISFDNSTLRLKESLKLEEYMRLMAVDKELLGVVSIDSQMHRSLLSMVEPEPIRLLSQTTLPEIGTGVAMTGGKALVVAGGVSGAQLLMYDVQDPAKPRQVQAMDIPSSNIYQVSIFVTGPYVVLANGAGGVEVFSDGS